MRRRLLLPALLLLSSVLLLSPVPVASEGISGAMEPSYIVSREKTEDSSGSVTRSESKTFTQRYFLGFDKQFYPNLSFVASGTFDKINGTTTGGDGTETKTILTTESGLMGLRLNSQLISSGTSFSRREEKAKFSSGSTVPRVMDTFSATLAYRPEGLPSTNALFSRTAHYDKNRELEDSVNDLLTLSIRHDPVRNLNLQGTASFTDTRNKLSDTETRLTNYTGRAAYTRRFGDNVSTSASYSYSRSETETITTGSGELPPLPVTADGGGLSNTTGTTPTTDIMLQNAALTDFNLTESAGVNIGPVQPTDPTANRLRQIGLDFGVPKEVNTVSVWVQGNIQTVFNQFIWEIYVGTDTNIASCADNLNWQLRQTVPSESFSFNRFTINFNNETARCLKIVTTPLSTLPPGLNTSDFNVTQMEASLRTSAADVIRQQTQSSSIYDLGVKWMILERPNLSYNFYYWGSSSNPGGVSRNVLTNSLNLAHRFNRVFSGSAMISREDSKDTEKRSANVFGASLTAVPLPTLVHRLTLSSRLGKTEEGSSDSHSVTLSNTAELYRGLNVILTGGANISTSETERKALSTFITAGTSVVPHYSLSFNAFYTQTNTKQTGGGTADISSSTRRGDIGVSYSPFNTLHIAASYGLTAGSRQDTTSVQNYAVSWSPLQGGALLFNLTFNESITSEGQKDRTISPGLIWYLTGNAQLQTSYQFSESDSPALKTQANAWLVSLRVAL